MEIVTRDHVIESPHVSGVITPDLLMRGMAHDLNNMLAVVASGLSIVERGTDRAKQAAIIGGMRHALMNAASLAKDIVSLTGDHNHSPETLNAAKIFEGIEVLAAGALGDEVAFEKRVAKDLWPVRVVRTYLEFALLNLFVNASDAMPEGGTLTLEARNTSLDRLPEGRPKDFVRIEVIDTGEGIPRNIIGRVFEPFFTTKGASGGTGLGLGQVRRFAEQHGGRVMIESVAGQGTTVVVLLPRA